MAGFRFRTGRSESRRDGGGAEEEEVGMGAEMAVTMARGVGKEREMETAVRKGMERYGRRVVERRMD